MESNPAFSPDGRRIAFSAQYEGNTDVYIVPVEGGVPTRLTWHPGADKSRRSRRTAPPCCSRPARAVFTNRYTQLFKVPIAGGVRRAAADSERRARRVAGPGGRIAYNPIAGRYQQWKEYRGGTVSRIWIYDPVGRELEKVPQPPTRSNDAGSDVDRRHRVLPIRSQRRVQHLLLRPANEVREAGHDATATSRSSARRRAAARSSSSRPGTCTCSTRPRRKHDATEDWRRRPTCRRRGRGSRAARDGFATRRSRRPARAPRSSSAARSSPCRPRRETRAT